MSTHDLLKEATEQALATLQSQSVRSIVQERVEQKMLHGYDDDHDSVYEERELIQAASAILALDSGAYAKPANEAYSIWPDGWDSAILTHIVSEKPYLNRLAVAGALIVAEMDRVLHLPEEAQRPD